MSNPSPSATKSAANRFDPSNKTSEPKAAETNHLDDGFAPEEEGTIVELATVLIVMKTTTSTVVDVWEWELDVLREIHGAESIIVQSVRDALYPHSAAEAMQYLRNKYSTREQDDIIKQIYPRLRDFAKSTGLPYQAGDEGSMRSQASSVIVREPTPVVRKTASTKHGTAGSGARGSAGE